MDLNRLHKMFFVGIGGIGMSALARYFHAKGIDVCGYDKTPSPITEALISEGIKVYFEDVKTIIPHQVDLAVYTPAVPKNTNVYLELYERGVPIIKRAELLGLIAANIPTIAIAGTHGKTTISTLVAHILKTAGVSTLAFLGGISVNYNTNFLACETPEWLVTEADEFDRSFLFLNPQIALISAIDADHLDIYGSEEALRLSFEAFKKRIKPGGTIITKKGLETGSKSSLKNISYHCSSKADFYATEVEVKDGQYLAHIIGFDKTEQITLGLPGRHNLENALGAMAVANSIGIDKKKIIEAVATYKGVKRRFEKVYQSQGMVFIDDYAHHPEEIKACIGALRELYPNREITAIFQPHLFSRTRDLMQEFAKSLSQADRLLLLDIYPAREAPIEGISSEKLLEKVTLKHKNLVQKKDIFKLLSQNPPDILVTMGAGDIDRLVPELAHFLKDKCL